MQFSHPAKLYAIEKKSLFPDNSEGENLNFFIYDWFIPDGLHGRSTVRDNSDERHDISSGPTGYESGQVGPNLNIYIYIDQNRDPSATDNILYILIPAIHLHILHVILMIADAICSCFLLGRYVTQLGM
jgi:hypothetical protein